MQNLSPIIAPAGTFTEALPEEEGGLIDLKDVQYPDSSKAGFRDVKGDVDPNKLTQAVMEQLRAEIGQVFNMRLPGTEAGLQIVFVPTDLEDMVLGDRKSSLLKLQGAVLTAIRATLAFSDARWHETGWLKKALLQKTFQIGDGMRILQFLAESTSNIAMYQGNAGQIKMAAALGKMNLAQLYSLASGLGLVEQLGWTKMNVPYAMVEKFQEELQGNEEKYNQGNASQIEMAAVLGGMNLAHLYTLASGLGLVEQLGWTMMDVPYKMVKKFQEELKVNEEKYKWNAGQIEMAAVLGGMNLGHLYSLASGLGLLEQLGWTCMNVPYEMVEKFRNMVAGKAETYKGNDKQIEMAAALGGMNLGHLYSLASGLGLAEQLEWTCMDVPYEMVKKFQEELQSNEKKYNNKGNTGQIEMAAALGGMNLGQLYTLASGLGLVEKFKWTYMNVPYAMVEKFRNMVAGKAETYKGNDKQIEMAAALGGMNLGHLYSLASGLGLVEQLEWTCMNVPYERAGAFNALIKELIQEGTVQGFSNPVGRLKFASEHHYKWSTLLQLAEAYDVNGILNWRIKSKNFNAASSRAPSYDFRPEDGLALSEKLSDPEQKETGAEMEEREFVDLILTYRENKQDHYKEEIIKILDMQGTRIQQFFEELEGMSEETIREIFEE